MDALEAERQAGVLQLQERVVDDRVGLGAVELLEEAHAADALAEEAAEHAVLRPELAVAGHVLDDVVGGGAEHILGGAHLLGGEAVRPHLPLEILDRLGDLLHQLGEGRCTMLARSRPSSSSSGAAARIIGLSLGATMSSRRSGAGGGGGPSGGAARLAGGDPILRREAARRRRHRPAAAACAGSAGPAAARDWAG